MMLQNQASFRYPELAGLAFANMLDDLNIENGRSSEYPQPITTMCKNEFIAQSHC